MQIHRVQGNDIKDALERARGIAGDDAFLLGHETTRSGGVTVSVARRPPGVVPIEPVKPAEPPTPRRRESRTAGRPAPPPAARLLVEVVPGDS